MLISTQFGPVVAPFGSFDMSIHIDFAELDSFIGDDAWSISFENTGSVELDVDFFL